MVELMVSMSLMVVGLLGIAAVLSQSLGLNRVAANQYIAANLAAEGIEVTKNILDTNFINGDPWNDGFAVNGDFGVAYDSTALDATKAAVKLYYDPATRRYSYDTSGEETQFVRTITIENVSATEIKVVSTVTWRDRGGLDLEINAEDHFRNWREIL